MDTRKKLVIAVSALACVCAAFSLQYARAGLQSGRRGISAGSARREPAPSSRSQELRAAPAPHVGPAASASGAQAVATETPNGETSARVFTGPAHQRWEQEPKDPSWASKLEDEVQALFDDPELDHSQLIDVDCRTTLCRIEVHFDDHEAFERLVHVSGARGPLTRLHGVSELEPNRVVTYVTRASDDNAG
jgi:hypothetical protein